MNILTRLIDKVNMLIKKKQSNEKIKSLKHIFMDECAFCGNKIDYSILINIEDKNIPCCLYCKALTENGTKWTSILKKNYKNEKRKYCNKYLRIIVFFSDVD